MCGAHIEIGLGFGRKKGEAPPSRRHDRDVVGGIIVRRDFCRIADPQPGLGRCRGQRHWMRIGKTGDKALGKQPLDDQRIGFRFGFLLAQGGEEDRKARAASDEIQRLPVGSIVKPSLLLRIGSEDLDGGVGRLS